LSYIVEKITYLFQRDGETDCAKLFFAVTINDSLTHANGQKVEIVTKKLQELEIPSSILTLLQFKIQWPALGLTEYNFELAMLDPVVKEFQHMIPSLEF
jgi:hypothetical protein